MGAGERGRLRLGPITTHAAAPDHLRETIAVRAPTANRPSGPHTWADVGTKEKMSAIMFACNHGFKHVRLQACPRRCYIATPA